MRLPGLGLLFFGFVVSVVAEFFGFGIGFNATGFLGIGTGIAFGCGLGGVTLGAFVETEVDGVSVVSEITGRVSVVFGGFTGSGLTHNA